MISRYTAPTVALRGNRENRGGPFVILKLACRSPLILKQDNIG